MATPDDFQIARVILHAQSNVIARLKTRTAKYIRQLHGALMKLAVGGDLAGFGLDHGGEFGLGLGKYSWVHGHKLVNDTGHSRLGRKLSLA
jgi:hypothetical protein